MSHADRAAMDQAEARAREVWATLPDHITVAEAVAMPWGGERNLALRKALGVKFPGKTVVMVNQGDVIQVGTSDRRKADHFARTLEADLDGWTVTVNRVAADSPGGRWLVTCHRNPA